MTDLPYFAPPRPTLDDIDPESATTDRLIAIVRSHRAGEEYPTGEQLLGNLPKVLRALCDHLLSGEATALDVAYRLASIIEICQSYNLRKTQVIMTPWGRAIACYGRRFALPVIVPTWRHRLGSATADALAGRPADL